MPLFSKTSAQSCIKINFSFEKPIYPTFFDGNIHWPLDLSQKAWHSRTQTLRQPRKQWHTATHSHATTMRLYQTFWYRPKFYSITMTTVNLHIQKNNIHSRGERKFTIFFYLLIFSWDRQKSDFICFLPDTHTYKQQSTYIPLIWAFTRMRTYMHIFAKNFWTFGLFRPQHIRALKTWP